MKITETNEGVLIENADCLNVELSVLCGQAFRWEKREDGVIHGVVKGKSAFIKEENNRILFMGSDTDEFNSLWKPYFDLDRDYKAICEKISLDENIKKATKEYYGIRILRQEPWEALCSFIISQNNNIPRIMGIIDRLSKMFGKENEKGDFSFPSFEDMKGVTAEDLSELRAGFRNKYIVDAVEKLNSGEIVLEDIYSMDIEKARETLMKIKGVGPKVAECTLLYGFGRIEAFPIDVWVKRIMAELYPKGLPECIRGVEGIAQQYLFHWRRNLKEEAV